MIRHAITEFAPDLTRQGSIWVGPRREELSYPDDGNDACLQVEETSFWFAHRNRCIIAILRLFPPPGVLFDVGGGNGFVTAALLSAGISAILVEPGRAGAENAARRGVPDVICATVEGATFLPGTIPAVGLFDVLEHIEDDVAFLKNLRRLIRPGGRIYIAVPAFQRLWSDEDVSAGHYRRYSLESLTHALVAAGFTIEHGTYMFQCLWLPVFVLRTIAQRLRLRNVTVGNSSALRRDHDGSGNRLLNGLLNREHAAIRAGRTISFGSSCFVVARA